MLEDVGTFNLCNKWIDLGDAGIGNATTRSI
jgi:hypothetical protein